MKVSVLMPTFNHGNLISESIESVLTQSYQDFELIILDNCSTDSTEEVVSKYLVDSRVQYFRNEFNIGAINNFNKAFGLAKGELIKFLFSDDLLLPNCLIEFVDTFKKYPSVVLVSSYFEYFGSLSQVNRPMDCGLIPGNRAIESILMTGQNWIGSPSNSMIRADSYDGKGYDSNWLWWGDLDLYCRLLNKGDLYIVPKVLSKFRYHDSSATNNCIKNFIDKHDEYFYLKHVRQHNLYPGVEAKAFQKLILQRAINWVRLIPRFLSRKRFDLVASAINVAFKERLLSYYIKKRLARSK